MNALSLRFAGPDDCRFFWEVNNDPAVRAQSVQTGPIPYESHETWYAAKLDSAVARLFVGCVGDRRVGVVRYDIQGDEAVVSVALKGAFRGRGLGKAIIAEATAAALGEETVAHVTALVRPDNPSSLRAFRACGYTEEGEREVSGVVLTVLRAAR